jgi:PKD domain
MKNKMNCLLFIILFATGCTKIKPFEKLNNSCSSKISISNTDINSSVKSIKFTGLNGTIITHSEIGLGWTQFPNLPQSVSWIVPLTGFPTGNPIAGNFKLWIRNGSGNLVKVEYFDITGKVLCTKEVVLTCKNDPVIINCGKVEPNICCQFALRIFNNIPNTFKKIKIIPLNPSEITGVNLGIDDDIDWSLTQVSNTYTFDYINTTGNGFIPFDATNYVDSDFTISVSPGSNNPKVKVLWIDGNGNTQKTEEITLVCMNSVQLEDESFEYDWTVNTISQGGIIHDSLLFAGAEALPCNANFIMKIADIEVLCPTINSSLSCLGNQLSLTLSCTTVSADVPSPSYHWKVDGSSMGTLGTSLSTPLNGIGQSNAKVLLEVHGISPTTGIDSIFCTQTTTIPYCKATAEFVTLKPTAICNPPNNLGGWNVPFIHVTPCTNIVSYKWDFGDGSTVINQTGSIVDPTHKYADAGTYDATLSITDQYGCTNTYKKSVIIPKDCDPDFHINYEWCEDGQKENQKYQVKVEFTNLSVSFCSSKYVWDYGDGSAPDSLGVHIYNTFPNQPYKVTLTMKDKDLCPSGKTKAYVFNLKPVTNNMSVVACPDGIVKFSNPCDVHWKLPNWQLLTQDPSYYCLPSPFDPWLNLQINAFLGSMGTSVPQLWVNAWKYHNFQLRMKDGTNFSVSSTCKEEQGTYATGTCTKQNQVNVQVTCCINDFNKSYKRFNTISGKDYRMKIRFKTHYRERHSAPGSGACVDFYLSSFLPEQTHLMTRTIFQRRKKIGKLKYWIWSRADNISTGVTSPSASTSNFLTNGGPNGCNCIDAISWSKDKTKQSRIFLSCRGNTPSLYRIDKNSLLQSYHKIIKNGVTWDEYIDKPIGYCSPQ